MLREYEEALKEYDLELTNEQVNFLAKSLGQSDMRKSPTELELSLFKQALTLIKEGKSTQEAADLVLQNSNEEAETAVVADSVNPVTQNMIEFAQEQAEIAVDQTLSELVKVARAEKQLVNDAFRNRFRTVFMEKMSDPTIRQAFIDKMEGQSESGKQSLPLQSSPSNIVLPSN